MALLSDIITPTNIVTATSTTTLTNKTISGASNTVTGLPLTTAVTGTLPVANGGTGITSLGTGVATFLGTPTSANLASAVTNETGSGSLVFGTSPTISAANLTGATQFAGSSGSSGQVLTSAGSGSAPTWGTPSSGAMVNLGSSTVNGSSAINLDFISSTYTNYMLMIEGIYSYTGATVSPILQYRCAGTTDTNNAYGYVYTQGTGAAWSGGSVGSDNRINVTPVFPNGSNYLTSYFGVINISTFLNDNTNQYIVKANAHIQNANGGKTQAYPNLVYATYQGSYGLNSAVTGVSVTLSNGGTFVGKVTLYGLT